MSRKNTTPAAASKPRKAAAARPVSTPPAPASTTRAPKAAKTTRQRATPTPQPSVPAKLDTASAAATKPPSAKPEKAPKKKAATPRPRLVRDSFTMPQDDFALIAALKGRALSAHRHAKKSELLRAGLQALAAMDAQALVASLERLQPIQMGRPKKSA